jgi:hypothetical protein
MATRNIAVITKSYVDRVDRQYYWPQVISSHGFRASGEGVPYLKVLLMFKNRNGRWINELNVAISSRKEDKPGSPRIGGCTLKHNTPTGEVDWLCCAFKKKYTADICLDHAY